MSEDTTYNGWKNYETWAVGMYLDGNYTGSGTYEYVIETVKEALERSTFNPLSGKMNDRYEVSQALKSLVENDTDPCGYGNDDGPELNPLVSDLLGAALSSVDWYELADAWITNVSELNAV